MGRNKKIKKARTQCFSGRVLAYNACTEPYVGFFLSLACRITVRGHNNNQRSILGNIDKHAMRCFSTLKTLKVIFTFRKRILISKKGQW